MTYKIDGKDAVMEWKPNFFYLSLQHLSETNRQKLNEGILQIIGDSLHIDEQWNIVTETQKIKLFNGVNFILKKGGIRILNARYVRTAGEIAEIKKEVIQYSKTFVDIFERNELQPIKISDCWSCYAAYHVCPQHLWYHVYGEEFVPALFRNTVFDNASTKLEIEHKRYILLKWKNKWKSKKFTEELEDNLSTYLIRKFSMPI